uniref:Uncharacterized protein n=1 Tax=Arundo donax TaxID=35708 RepID=A0A0A9F267_ARUDO
MLLKRAPISHRKSAVVARYSGSDLCSTSPYLQLFHLLLAPPPLLPFT